MVLDIDALQINNWFNYLYYLILVISIIILIIWTRISHTKQLVHDFYSTNDTTKKKLMLVLIYLFHFLSRSECGFLSCLGLEKLVVIVFDGRHLESRLGSGPLHGLQLTF